MNKDFIYLAIPYTFNSELSFEIANRVSAVLMDKDTVVFSPISHSHPIADYMDEGLRYSQEFWMNQDLTLLSLAKEMCLVVIGKNGEKLIEESKGCQSEIKFAQENNIPIKRIYYEPGTSRT